MKELKEEIYKIVEEDYCEFSGRKKRSLNPQISIRHRKAKNNKGNISIGYTLTGNTEFCRNAAEHIQNNKQLKLLYSPKNNILLFDFCREKSSKSFTLSGKMGMFSASIKTALTEFKKNGLLIESVCGDYEPILVNVENRTMYGVNLNKKLNV